MARRVWGIFYLILDTFWPKERNLVIFSQRDRYWDNSRYLFYYLTHDPSSMHRCVWLAGSDEIFHSVLEENGAEHVVQMNSMKGFLLSLRAHMVVVTHGLKDLGPYHNVSSRKKVIHLWHAINFKQVGVLNRDLSSWKRFFYRLESIRFSLMLASSRIDRWVTACCHAIDLDRVAVTGLPRNDALLGAAHAPPRRQQKEIHALLRGRKAVLYAPTWRDDGATRWFPFSDMNMERLIHLLKELNAVLLLRPHQYDFVFRDQIEPLLAGTEALAMLCVDDYPDVQEVLPSLDAVITDYSSIFIDYLLLDRPVLFLPYDLEEYDLNRGLAYDYDHVTPGPKISDFESFLTEIRHALTGNDGYGAERSTARRIFYTYTDTNSCRRIAEAMRSVS